MLLLLLLRSLLLCVLLLFVLQLLFYIPCCHRLLTSFVIVPTSSTTTSIHYQHRNTTNNNANNNTNEYVDRARGFAFRRLDGTMNVQKRDVALRDFKEQPSISVMIMSLKAASLGLNMMHARNVFLLDCWWNPTTEEQAIDRTHR